MKLILSMMLVVLGYSNLAYSTDIINGKCADAAVAAAVSKNYKTFKASTSDCGIKTIHMSEQLETYLVCTTDETDPMEYMVVLQTQKFDKNGVAKTCILKLVDVATDSATPNFESEEGLLQGVQTCSMDDADNAKLICKK